MSRLEACGHEARLHGQQIAIARLAQLDGIWAALLLRCAWLRCSGVAHPARLVVEGRPMPFFARFWWLWLLPAALAAGSVALLPGSTLALDMRLSSDGHLSIGEYAPLALHRAAMLLYVGRFGALAVGARRRKRLRLAARRGDIDAVPLARITSDPARAPNLSEGPLALMWRPTGSRGQRGVEESRRARRVWRGLTTALQLIILAVFVWLVYSLLARISLPSSEELPSVLSSPPHRHRSRHSP
jgi:hypothetical protein